ncbi:hypothetical protein TNCV_84121 [Trichonephila clavipes]|nr:hypothetical protein TNCV_84121 [Trichonephila clavipes]
MRLKYSINQSKAIGDGFRNFEPKFNYENNTWADSSFYNSTPRELTCSSVEITMTPTISCSPKYVNPVTFLITVVSLQIVDSQYSRCPEESTNLRRHRKKRLELWKRTN